MDAYPADYFEARDRFCRQAQCIDWSPGSLSLQQQSSENMSALSIDWAATGAEDPSRTLIVSSGLHGVEGFFGSAVQLRALESIFTRWTPPDGLRVVFVHALNPFGFANRRRVDDQNIDPNRNFKLPQVEHTGSAEQYRRMNHWLNPPSAPARIDLFRWQACIAILRHGLPTLKQAVAGGQHDYPRGLFYGGRERSTVFRDFDALWADWTRKAARVLHIDLHTGLGRFADYKLLIDYGIDADESLWLSEGFGEDRLDAGDSTGIAYRAGGNLGRWCRATYDSGRYLYLCAEFGTYGPLAVLGALRAENRAHFYSAPSSPAYARAKERMMNAFCPRDPGWRATALRNGLSLVNQALRALADTP